MKEIINTESISIVFDANKRRLYYTGKKLREMTTEQEEQVRNMIFRLHRLIPQQITVLSDVTQMSPLSPQITENIIQHITLLRQAKNVIAVAQVMNMEDDTAIQQFKTILDTSDESDVQINTFNNRDAAEAWLDSTVHVK
jgi:hypothetical protein